MRDAFYTMQNIDEEICRHDAFGDYGKEPELPPILGFKGLGSAIASTCVLISTVCRIDPYSRDDQLNFAKW